jgi:hypothetical protein
MRILSILCLSAAVASCNPGETPDDATKEAVLRLINDPASAEFREIRPCDKPGGFQGEVNWTGPAGGKVGFTNFIVIGYEAGLLEDRPGASDISDFGDLQRRCYSDAVMNAAAGDLKAIEGTP